MPHQTCTKFSVLLPSVIAAGAVWFAPFGWAAASDHEDEVAVSVAKITRQDFPFYVEGLGKAQGMNTATVRAQVDGQIIRVAFQEGQFVHAGDVLIEIEPRPYQAAFDGAAAKQAQDEAQLAAEKKSLARFAALLEKHMVDQQAFDAEDATVAGLSARVKADAAAVADAKIRLEFATVRAPIDGRTGIRLIDQGNIVHATDSAGLVTISQIQPIAVMFKFPETALGEINAAMAKTAGGAVAALLIDKEGAVLAQGELSAVDNQVESSSGTIKAKAIFSNDNHVLWPGQFAHVRVITDSRRAGLVVPGSAIQQGPNNLFVYVVGADKRVEMKPVKLARMEQDVALLDGGVAEGEIVVTDGQYLIRPGSKVKVKSQ